MTRRERLERKLAKREEWADKAGQRAAQRFDAARRLADGIPLGQPILVGHHSEKRHRRDLARIDGNMAKGCEEQQLAQHHAGKADGLAQQLERSIYSDDPDAVEQLRAKVAGLEQRRELCKAVNAAWRKAGRPAADASEAWAGIAAALGLESDAKILREGRLNMAHDFMPRGPFPGYVTQNLGGEIRRAEQRIAEIGKRAQRQQQAEAAGGIVLAEHPSGYCTVTFAEKPAREVLHALKDAGFHWSGGAWHGRGERLPASVRAMLPAAEPGAGAGPASGEQPVT